MESPKCEMQSICQETESAEGHSTNQQYSHPSSSSGCYAESEATSSGSSLGCMENAAWEDEYRAILAGICKEPNGTSFDAEAFVDDIPGPVNEYDFVQKIMATAKVARRDEAISVDTIGTQSGVSMLSMLGHSQTTPKLMDQDSYYSNFVPVPEPPKVVKVPENEATASGELEHDMKQIRRTTHYSGVIPGLIHCLQVPNYPHLAQTPTTPALQALLDFTNKFHTEPAYKNMLEEWERPSPKSSSAATRRSSSSTAKKRSERSSTRTTGHSLSKSLLKK